MSTRVPAFALVALSLVPLCGGCGGPAGGGGAQSTGTSGTAKRGVFVGFGASDPLINAMKQGKLQGTVVQNPYRMGELGVKTLVQHLEKKPVEAVISTGETVVTPENMDQPEVATLLHPPQAEHRDSGSLSGA